MKFIILIPSVHQETTDRCLKSIDKSLWPHVRIVDNTTTNKGVSYAWNQGAKEVVNEDLDYLIILSAGVTFYNGMLDFIEELERTEPEYGLDTQLAWHCIAIARQVFEEIGYFDERFFAYYEDSDFVRRLWLKYGVLAGVLNQGVVNVPRLPRFGVDARCEIAHAYHHGVKVDWNESLRKFVDKWGGEPSYEHPSDLEKLAKEPLS